MTMGVDEIKLAWLGVAWRGLAWFGLAWCGVAWCGVAWLGLAWLGLAGKCSCASTYDIRHERNVSKLDKLITPSTIGTIWAPKNAHTGNVEKFPVLY